MASINRQVSGQRWSYMVNAIIAFLEMSFYKSIIRVNWI